jgi:hypothetical protein
MHKSINSAWNPSLCLIRYYVLPMYWETNCHGCKSSNQGHYHSGQENHNHVIYNEDERMCMYAHFLNSCYDECGSVVLSFVHLRKDHGNWWTTSMDDISSKKWWVKDGLEVMGLPSRLMTRLTNVKLIIYAMWSMRVISTCIWVCWMMELIPFHKKAP